MGCELLFDQLLQLGPELTESLRGVSLLGIRSNTTVTSRVLEGSPALEAIGCFCIGTNQVDLDAAMQRGVGVFNAPYSNPRSVVELVIGEIIALARRLPEKTQRMHDGMWDKSARGSHEVRGRTLGIVGYGNIGTQLANVAEALGMRAVFYDKADRPAHGNARRMASLAALLDEADVVNLHGDVRPGNAGLFGAEEFAAMRPRALFIKASRGMVVDYDSLRSHVRSGHIAGAAVDVFPVEPKAQGDAFESVLRGLDNVILTPHIDAGGPGGDRLVRGEQARRFRPRREHGVVGQPPRGLAAPTPRGAPVELPPSQRPWCARRAQRGVRRCRRQRDRPVSVDPRPTRVRHQRRVRAPAGRGHRGPPGFRALPVGAHVVTLARYWTNRNSGLVGSTSSTRRAESTIRLIKGA